MDTCAQRFAALGDDVVALSRDREALARLQVRTAVCDVTDEDAVNSTFEQLGPALPVAHVVAGDPRDAPGRVNLLPILILIPLRCCTRGCGS